MFTLKPIAVCISMLTIASAALAQAPQFGQPIAPADIAAWDISIGPDGVGLPPGRGTAIEGEAIYRNVRPVTERREPGPMSRSLARWSAAWARWRRTKYR